MTRLSAGERSSRGVEPRCFDAPLDTPEGILRCQGLTFLTQTPDGLMSRRVEPLLGLAWGYTVADGAPTIVPVARAGQDDWDGVQPVLRSECPTWTFGRTLTHV